MLFPAIYSVAFDAGRWGVHSRDLILVVAVPIAMWFLVLKLTVTVTFTELRLAFLLGWPRKRINRSDIRSVMPVRDWTRDARAVRSDSFMWISGRRQGVLIVLVGGKSLLVGADDADALVAVLNT